MKKSLKFFLLIFVISLFTNNLFAQGAYINLNTGYGLGINLQSVPSFSEEIRNANEYIYEHPGISLGKGFTFGGAVGYMFHKNIGAELGLSYLVGGKSKAKSSYDASRIDKSLSSQMLRIIPSLVITPSFKKINPYAKFGLLIGTGFIMNTEKEYYASSTIVPATKTKSNGGIALGLSSGIGTTFNLSDKVLFYGEFNMVNLSYAPTKGELVHYIWHNGDWHPAGSEKIKYVDVDMDSYIGSSNTSSGNSQPRQELKEKFSYGSVGINLGLRINFLKISKTNPQ